MNSFEIKYIKSEERIFLKKHRHNAYEIIFILSGSAVLTVNKNKYNLSRGNLIFLNNLEPHSIASNTVPYERYYAIVPRYNINQIMPSRQNLSIFQMRFSESRNIVYIDENNIEKISSFFQNAYKEYTSQNIYWKSYALSCLNLLMISVNRIIPQLKISEEESKILLIVYKIQNKIQNRYRENIKLENLAKSHYVSLSYLSKSFHNITGYSFRDYLLLQRISEAKDQLIQTDNKISDIAYNCGFNDSSRFIKNFKKKEGITPLQFRKTHNLEL